MGYRACASLTDIFPQSIDLLGLGRLDMHKRAGGQTLREQLQYLRQHIQSKRRIKKYHVIAARVEAQEFQRVGAAQFDSVRPSSAASDVYKRQHRHSAVRRCPP